MSDNQLVPTVNGTQLQVYGDRNISRELGNRLMSLHPQSRQVGKEGMFMIAQIAIAYGASPLPGMNGIHVWKNPKTGLIQFSFGIDYWRLNAEENGGIKWIIAPRAMTEEERVQYSIADGKVAAIAKGYRKADFSFQELKQWLDAGVNINDAIEHIIGDVPVGIAIADETSYQDNKAGRPAIWTAMKRAERDILSQLFPPKPLKRAMAGMVKQDDGTFAPNYEDPAWEAEYEDAEVEDGFYQELSEFEKDAYDYDGPEFAYFITQSVPRYDGKPHAANNALKKLGFDSQNIGDGPNRVKAYNAVVEYAEKRDQEDANKEKKPVDLDDLNDMLGMSSTPAPQKEPEQIEEGEFEEGVDVTKMTTKDIQKHLCEIGGFKDEAAAYQWMCDCKIAWPRSGTDRQEAYNQMIAKLK